jgi:serine phosphatase RsbU (regulator of sigma subunit)
MKPRFTISRKIGFGFAVVLLTTLILFFLTYETLRTGRITNDRINTVYNPSISILEQLKSTILRSRTSITAWAFVQSREDTREKRALVQTVNVEIPGQKAIIDSLSVDWSEAQRRKKERVYKELSALLGMYGEVQSTLNNMQSYDDPYERFRMNEFAEEDGEIYRKSNEVINNLNELIQDHRSNTTADSVTMIKSFDTLEFNLRILSILLFLFGVVIAYFTIRSIVRPVSLLKGILEELGRGIFPEKAVVDTGDEIGEMSMALEQLVQGLKRTTEFSREVGQGNFEIDYKPLSEGDVLGKALLSMRDDLKDYERRKLETERELEEKVEERTSEVVKQKNKIEKQNQQRKELLDNITASIRYAKKLQESILPSEAYMNSLLGEHFLYFKPKDIVSGDFYFVKERQNKVVVATVDCTGHGVPGAFMSLVGHNALNRAVNENPSLDPAAILKDLSRLSAKALNRTSESVNNRDGMDLALCVYDKANASLQYAGAFSPLYLVRGGDLSVHRPDKVVIGDADHLSKSYTTHNIQLEDGDMIYLFSDGYVDQFGGDDGRKFMYGPFRDMLIKVSALPVEAQLETVSGSFDKWRRTTLVAHEQVDDILVMGIRHTTAS